MHVASAELAAAGTRAYAFAKSISHSEASLESSTAITTEARFHPQAGWTLFFLYAYAPGGIGYSPIRCCPGLDHRQRNLDGKRRIEKKTSSRLLVDLPLNCVLDQFAPTAQRQLVLDVSLIGF